MRTQNQHMKLRHGWWHMVRRVPSDVADSFGKTTVEVALKTRDVRVARRIRDRVCKELEAEWTKLRWKSSKTPPLTAADILSEEQKEEQMFLLHLQLDELVYEQGGKYYGADEAEVLERVYATPQGKAISHRMLRLTGKDTVEEAGEKFLMVAANMRPRTISSYRSIYKRASAHLPTPTDVTPVLAREYIQSEARQSSAKTISNIQIALRALWSHLGLRPQMWSGFRVDAAVAEKRRDIWTDDEVKAVLQAAKQQWMRDAIAIAAYTGARVDEIRSMTYDAEADTITITRSKTDAGLRTIPCPDVARAAVIRWSAIPLDKRPGVRTPFAELKKGLKYPATKVFHSFRHTVASKLHDVGVQESTAALILGQKHKEITFGRYGNKVDVETLREPLNRVRYKGLPA